MDESFPISKTLEQLEAEYQEREKMLQGLDYFILTSLGVNQDLNDLYTEYTNIGILFFERSTNIQEILGKLIDIFERMRKLALRLGISAEEITEEKLRSYHQMMEAQHRDEERDLDRAFKNPLKPN